MKNRGPFTEWSHGVSIAAYEITRDPDRGIEALAGIRASLGAMSKRPKLFVS